MGVHVYAVYKVYMHKNKKTTIHITYTSVYMHVYKCIHGEDKYRCTHINIWVYIYIYIYIYPYT